MRTVAQFRTRRGAAALLATLPLIALAFAASASPANALVTVPPAHSRSWYVPSADSSPTGWAYNQGYADGQRDDANCGFVGQTTTAVLDFGQIDYDKAANQYKTYLVPNLSAVLLPQVAEATKAYARGWYNATSTCPRLIVAMGTNNSKMCPFEGTPQANGCLVDWAGKNWGTYTGGVRDFLVAIGASWQVTAAAADDMETNGQSESPPWDCATKTIAFVDGFNSQNPASARFYDYGDAWGSAGCWTDAQVHYVAYGATWNYPLPEIYTVTARSRWVDIRRQYYMKFEGVMTECQSEPTPGQQQCPVTHSFGTQSEWAPAGAWQDLWNALNVAGMGQDTLNFATNIRFTQ